MRTTDKEEAIIIALVTMGRHGQDSFTLPMLAEAIYRKQLQRPQHWRTALAATLRNLGTKVEKRGCKLRRVSVLGRGHLGVYEFSGDFAKFLKKELVF